MTDTLLLNGLNRDSDSAKALLATIDWLYWKNPSERPYELQSLDSIMEEIEDYVSDHPLGKFIVLDSEATEDELNRKFIFREYDGERWMIPRPPILTKVVKKDGWTMTVIEDQDAMRPDGFHRFACSLRKPHEVTVKKAYWAEREPDYEAVIPEMIEASLKEKKKIEG